jgi:mannose-1-phosphate guanylyltransferase
MTRPHAIIMAGGSGTRFWPASRKLRPKQFLPLARGRSLLEATIERARAVAGRERTWIVTNADQAAALPAVVEDFPAAQVIVEPQARDTGPCVALAAARIDSREPGAVMAVMPADHLIEPLADFVALLARGASIAADGRTLVTFGIPPTGPATIYGYVERGARLDPQAPAAFRVARFREKPDLATAREYLASGRFLWNSGIFVWTARAILAAMDAGNAELAAAARAMLEAARAGDEPALERAFRAAPRISVDYAVMEKAPHAAVVQADLSWNDVGSFLNLAPVAPPDADGNVTLLHGAARALAHEARDCVVWAEGARTVALYGVRDLVVVAVDDAVLVCSKARADELKALVGRLEREGRADLL